MSVGRLPDGFVAEIDARVRVLDGGAVLLGGSPPTILRLSPTARTLLRGGGVTVDGDVSAALARRLLDAGVALPRPTPPVRQRGVAATALPERRVGARDDVTPVTVVTPVRDNPDGAARLLGAIGHTAAPHEVIVVDDGSDDPAAMTGVACRHGARLLRHERARGPAAARNTGLAAAATPLVAFVDSDVVPATPGWLDALCAHFADPAVALVAPRIVALDTDGGSWLSGYERVRSALDLGARPAPVRPDSLVSYVPSAAVVVRVEAAGAGFDPALRVAEDVDLVLRLHAEGWRMRYAPDVTVAHQHRTALRPWLARKAFYGTGAAPLALRHPGKVPPVLLAPWTAAACLALAAQHRWSLPVTAALTGAATARLVRALPGLRGRWPLAAGLAARGLAGSLWQVTSGLVRHWWPAAAVACLVSSRARRAVAAAALAEGIADWARHGRGERLLPYLAAHRLDDLGYGAGLWRGAWRHRTVAPLLPRVAGRRQHALTGVTGVRARGRSAPRSAPAPSTNAAISGSGSVAASGPWMQFLQPT
ncbi:MAG: mycofactocin system glycosyltransferase [Pseudonocardiaceae bacterium]|nr:mycofactocin system glycosyltransferase [Pseudonocardiaceae bacterium]